MAAKSRNHNISHDVILKGTASLFMIILLWCIHSQNDVLQLAEIQLIQSLYSALLISDKSHLHPKKDAQQKYTSVIQVFLMFIIM